jgi:hypothetical protein
MKPKVYLETTIPSYLTAWPSRDLVTAAHQQITREWWQTRRPDFDLFTAQLVIDEASEGDPDAASRRLEVLKDILLLEPSEDVAELARALVEQIPFPERATDDAIHIAMAVVGGMDYLLTWNCTHIANAARLSAIKSVCQSRGYEVPIICTPEQLLEEE